MKKNVKNLKKNEKKIIYLLMRPSVVKPLHHTSKKRNDQENY